LGALAAAIVFALAVGALARGRRSGYDSLTALALVGSLALGVILASDVFHSGSNVESLLFGSLLLIGRSDLWLAGGMSVLVLAAGGLLGRRWLATGFDPAFARAAGARSGLPDAALLGLAPAAAILLVLVGCGSGGSSSRGLPVVATTTQIGDWARQVGGPSVSVHQILRPNTDPHEYEPRPSDVVAASAARVVLENG